MRRPLLLQGPRGSGKTLVGRQIASATRRPFVDLGDRDHAPSGELGPQLPAVLAQTPAPVVALGADTLAERDARTIALDAAVILTLEASVASLAARCNEPEARVREQLECHRAAHVEAHARISTDGCSPEQIAKVAERVWRRDPIAVAAAERSYCVDIGRDIVDNRLPDLVRGASRLLVVTDDVVGPLHAARIDDALASVGIAKSWVELAHGEANKQIFSLERIWSEAHEQGIDRKSRLVALGGGVVTDVAGFAASAWTRGIAWIAVPTTLLAMVDASVGGKTAVDFRTAKNAVGAFWQPSGVVCDIDFLGTEPTRGFVGALAEVVKTAIIGDPALFELMEHSPNAVLAREPDMIGELVRRSIRVKARIVSRDERESGLRAVLNLGHTLGHALEAHGGYQRLSHGEAVALGMMAALRIGKNLGVTPTSLVERVRRLLEVLGLPFDLTAEPLTEASALIAHDKKRAGSRLAFVVARDLGRVETVPLELNELEGRAHELAR